MATAMFQFFSIVFKLFYLVLLYMVICMDVMNFASFVFLPQVLSLAMLSGALSSELFVLILVEHRVWGHINKINLEKYLDKRKSKKRWFWFYVVCISLTYFILMWTNVHHNHQMEAKDDPDKTK